MIKINEPVKGFRDIEGKEAEKRALIKNILIKNFELYEFEPAETPIIEYEEFVSGDNEKDEAVSDIFKLKDRGQRNLALRYEFTFQLKRIAKNKKLPYKRYQIGEVFRDEPVSSNRFRQFTQCDADIIGATPKSEAEILSMAKRILDELKIKNTIYFNNRRLLNEILESCGIKEKNAVIKEIDKLDKIPEKIVIESLKKYNAEKIIKILKNKESDFRKFKAYKEIEELKKACSQYNVKIVFQPFLARGLSYYTGSIFEIKSSIKETISAGGTYNINGSNSTGISFGLDRLALVSNILPEKKIILIISIEQDKKAIELSEKLRSRQINCSVFFGKPSKALDYANSKDIAKVIFIGAEEAKLKKVKLKDLKTGKETSISEKEIISRLKNN